MRSILAQIIFLLLKVKRNCHNTKEGTNFICFIQEILLKLTQDESAVSQLLKPSSQCKVREEKNHRTRNGTQVCLFLSVASQINSEPGTNSKLRERQRMIVNS